jgi:hypothetical protein
MARLFLLVLVTTAVRAKFGDSEAVKNRLTETNQVDRAEWHKILDKRVSQLEAKDTTHFEVFEERLRELEANVERLRAMGQMPNSNAH